MLILPGRRPPRNSRRQSLDTLWRLNYRIQVLERVHHAHHHHPIEEAGRAVV